VDLIACRDVLAVPVTCGSGDVTLVSSCWLKPVRISIMTGSDATRDQAAQINERFTAPTMSHGPESYAVRVIRTERQLVADPKYVPAYRSTPMPIETVELTVGADTSKRIEGVAAHFNCSWADAARRMVVTGVTTPP
jgi:hypothetical protein